MIWVLLAFVFTVGSVAVFAAMGSGRGAAPGRGGPGAAGGSHWGDGRATVAVEERGSNQRTRRRAPE